MATTFRMPISIKDGIRRMSSKQRKMGFPKVLLLACFLVNSMAALGNNGPVSYDCLLQLCRFSSGNKSAHSVFQQEVYSIDDLLSLQNTQMRTGDIFDCSTNNNANITCDCQEGTCRVTSIDLSGMNLHGRLPNSLGNLIYLQKLDLNNNVLGGPIPTSLAKLKQLWYIDLSFNNLRGPVPPFNGDNKELETLDLSYNKLSGLIPRSLVNLTKLSYLDLCKNNLEGPLPPFSSQNQNLKTLGLCRNRLNGSIPKGFGELSSLQSLYLQGNALKGTIPNELWNIKSLEELVLDDDEEREGQLPEQLGNLINLTILSLMNNNLSGELPKSIRELKILENLYIQGTNINGTIPEVIGGGLPKLEELWLIGNSLKGPLPKTFSPENLTNLYISDILGDENGGYPFPDLGNLTKLEKLTLRNCSLVGPIPPQIWKLPHLSYLDLSFNNLTGELPSALHPLIQSIYLRGNKLNGTLPGWVLSSPQRTHVDVSDNLFTNNATIPIGTIPQDRNLFACCSNSSDVKQKWLDRDYRCANANATNDHLYINCGGNETSIDEKTYEADLNPNGTSTFFLSNNSAWGYSSMGVFESTVVNKYIMNHTCNLAMADAALYMQARVAPISLKYYGFCLRNDNYNVTLHFAEIGGDAADQGDLGVNGRRRRLFNVDIQGEKVWKILDIEQEAGGRFQSKEKSQIAVVTHNRLEIHLYWSGKGSMYYPLYYGPLISAITVSAVPKNSTTNHSKLSPLEIGAIAGSSFIFVGVVIAALFWMLGWFGGKKPNKDGVELYPGGVYNFQQIKEATNNFDITKKIGETGSVFKGVLADGTEVAVKQLSVKSKQEAQQILTEIGIIYALQHPNLEKPMGCCVRERQVLLVYKYMENLSLQDALFGTDDAVRSKLSWRIRFKICHGIAKGLAFLHEESKLEVIHGNIKPANILLDKDFNVKISGFKYSELHDSQLNKEDTSNVPRAKDTGHMAPEYMQGRPLTPKADVYSFGLVILEIISGQCHMIIKPKEDIFLLNTAYKCYAEDNLEGLIDPSLCEHKDYKYTEVISIIHLAMQCVSPSFDLRPTMSEVVQILEGKKKFKGKRITPSPIIEPVTIPPQSYAFGSTSNSQDKQILQESDDN